MQLSSNLSKLVVAHDKNIYEALKIIKTGGENTCFVTKEKKIIGILTDGDVRKLILKKSNFKQKISKVCNRKFFSLPYNSSDLKIQSSLKKGRRIIPLVKPNNELIDYVTLNKNKTYSNYSPKINHSELTNVLDCLKSNWISSRGKYLQLFENEFSKFIQLKFSASVSSCTSGLFLAIKALNLKKGSEVIVPNVTFVSPINMILANNLKPVLCDVNNTNYTICTKHLKNLISKKTSAIICVHTYGYACDIKKVKKLISGKNIKLIEDCAESVGTKFEDRYSNNSDVSVYSFFGNKTITTGEGGMVLSKNKKLIDDIKLLRDHGMTKKKYWHDRIGYNFRMTNIQAAIGYAQTKKIKSIIKKKNKIFEWYKIELKKFKNIRFFENFKNTISSNWLVTFIFENITEIKRDKIIHELSKEGIECRPMFYPASKMEIYKNFKDKKKKYNVNSLKGISLPSSPNISKEDVRNICQKLIKISNLEV